MILRAALLLSLPLTTLPATAADAPRRAPPDRAAMSQFIATPLEPAGADNSRGVSRSERKSKRVRYTIPAAKRM